MKKIMIFVIVLLLSIGAFADDQENADNHVKVVAWGTTTSGNENKFLEDFGLKSGIGIDDLWIELKQFSLSGYYLPNHSADLQFTLSIGDKWRLTAGFNQYRKWWNTSAGHETTPGGYAVADWFPNTNTISWISDRDELYTTRRTGYVGLDYLVTPLQKVSLAYRRLYRNGDLSPLFRGFTFVGDVPFAATAASIRNYDENGQEAILKGNFTFGHWSLDLGATMLLWDNVYADTLGTFGQTEQIALTEMAADFSTDVFNTHAILGYTFNQGEVFGSFAYSKLDSDPTNSLTETGTFYSGARAGSGKVTQETTNWRLGFTWKLARQILLHAAANHKDRSKDGSYAETRTDNPAELNAVSSRDVITDQFRGRVRFLFRKFRLDLYGRYTSRKVDELSTTGVTESSFDKDLIQDLALSHKELRGGIRASLRLKKSVRLTLGLEAYKQEKEADLRDLTWGYYTGDSDTEGLDGSYRLSLPSGNWQFYVQGNVRKWDRDLAVPYFDPIYDPTQLLENTATEAQMHQHILTVATQIKRTVWNIRLGYIDEKFSLQDPFMEFNYQPVEYDLKGIVYGLGGAISGQAWSMTLDVNFIDTTGSQSHDRIRGSLDFSKRIRDNHTIVATYRYFSFEEEEFELDDYRGHFLTIGWRYQF
jgi:hypothetical protein